MKIMLITDAWHPQVNGVVRTLTRVIEECEAMGHTFEIVSPNDGFKTIPLPTYREIQLALGARKDRRRSAQYLALLLGQGALVWAMSRLLM